MSLLSRDRQNLTQSCVFAEFSAVCLDPIVLQATLVGMVELGY